MTLTLTVTAETPQEMATVLQTLGGNTLVTTNAQPTPAAKKEKTKEVPASDIAKTPTTAAPQASTDGQAVTLEQVREAATKQIQAGKRDEVAALLKECGSATKVTDLQVAHYGYFLEKVNAL